MAQNKKSFILYCDYLDTFSALPDEFAGKLIKHILEYVNDKNPQSDDWMLNATFNPIKQQLKRDLKKYEKIQERNRANGALGGRPKKTQKTQWVILVTQKTQKNLILILLMIMIYILLIKR